jgi:hypothetical protein
MKNYIFILLLAAFATACSDSGLNPFQEEEKIDEVTIASIYAGKEVVDTGLLQLNHTNEGVIFSVNQDSTFEYYSFQGEFLFNDEKVELNDISSLVEGMFVSNDNLGETEEGFKKARFAYASANLHTEKDLVLFDINLKQSSTICLIDIQFDEVDYTDICLPLSK